MDTCTPRTTLEMAGLIVSFAKSLGDDQSQLWSALVIARDAIMADDSKERRLQPR